MYIEYKFKTVAEAFKELGNKYEIISHTWVMVVSSYGGYGGPTYVRSS